MAKTTAKNNDTTANLGFEAKLWAAADALRNNMDAAEYKHVVLGLIFLKYISDAFEAKHAELEAQKGEIRKTIIILASFLGVPFEYKHSGSAWLCPILSVVSGFD